MESIIKKYGPFNQQVCHSSFFFAAHNLKARKADMKIGNVFDNDSDWKI